MKKVWLHWYLLPLSILYMIITGIRNFLFDKNILKSKSFQIPVICVGNLSVGGTGKTPHIELLVSILQEKYNVAVLSRGYRRKSKGFQYVNIDSNIAHCGDEPKQIKQKFPNITVAVDTNRCYGINQLIKDIRPDVVLLDDAFQHRKVKPYFSVLLTDYSRPYFHDFILPVGLLRESTQEKKRADIVIVTKVPENFSTLHKTSEKLKLTKNQSLFFSSIRYNSLQSVFSNVNSSLNFNYLIENKPDIFLITGIANPSSLENFLESKTKIQKHFHFPDHYTFTANDIDVINKEFIQYRNPNKLLITTEKDAMRLNEFSKWNEETKQKFFYVKISVEIIQNERQKFESKLLNVLESFNCR